jgi:DNA topoisomerase-1
MRAFGAVLPRIRTRIAIDLARPGLPREKVLAAVVRLLENSLIRIGNEEYVSANHSFGLTTMRDSHVELGRSLVHFEFRGKSGKRYSVDVNDSRLARIVRQCRDLPGQELFQYVDDTGARCDVNSADINRYLKEITGADFTAKDFRTWAGTVLAATALCDVKRAKSTSRSKGNVLLAIDAVAGVLGNTRAVCRKSYVHPAILDAYMNGSLATAARRRTVKAIRRMATLRAEEAIVLDVLKKAA